MDWLHAYLLFLAVLLNLACSNHLSARRNEDTQPSTSRKLIQRNSNISASRFGMLRNSSTDHLYQLDKKFYDINSVLVFCPNNSFDKFKPCSSDNLDGTPKFNVSILSSRDRSDLTSYPIISYPLVTSSHPIMANGSINVSPKFIANNFLIHDCYVTYDGRIFDSYSLFNTNGYDTLRSQMNNITTVIAVNEPILVLVQVFRSNFYHGFVEAYTRLLISLPVIMKYPRIKIAVEGHGHYFMHKKVHPVLNAILEPYTTLKAIQFVKIPNHSTILQAKTVIFPGHIPHVMPRVIARQFRKHMLKIPGIDWHNKNSSLNVNGILLYDRIAASGRRLKDSHILFQALKNRYNTVARVDRFYGNESLLDTIHLFHQSKIFIAAHGAGMSNLLFLPDNATVVEIFPRYGGKVPCFEEMSVALGFQHYHVNALDGHRKGKELKVNMSMEGEFMTRLFTLIDATIT
jgi:hypothetical protein